MSKRFRRKDLKHDEFITYTGRVTHWLMERRRRIGWGLLVVALIVSVVVSVRFAQQRQEERAAALLAAAMDVYRAPVVPPAPDPVTLPAEAEATPETPVETGAAGEAAAEQAAGDGDASATAQDTSEAAAAEQDPGVAETMAAGEPDATPEGPAGEIPETPPAVAEPPVVGLQFASTEEKYLAARERFLPIVERYGSRPSGRLASLYLGDCESVLGNTDAARTAFAQAADASGGLISAMGLYRLGQLELQAGNAEAAVAHFDRLLEGGTELFPPEEALLAKARAQEEAGDPRAALATYQRVVTDFAGSYSAVDAQSHVDELSARLGLDPNVQSD